MLLLLAIACSPTSATPSVWYVDADGDGFGDPAFALTALTALPGTVADSSDCDDSDAAVHPAAAETCNGIDDDCDGDTDGSDAIDAPTWYADADSDSYGDASQAVVACQAPAGTIATAGDCDDSDAAFHPGANEGDCTDPNDYNCDGSTGYADSDGDGWPACVECDDSDPDAWPGADERCNDSDDDCDGTVDESDAVDATTWYTDSDGDGWGNVDLATVACEAPPGTVDLPGDCWDDNSAFYPGAPETDCTDPNDYNCDGSSGYADLDADGWAACAECDDADAAVRPDALETCNDADDDCDGTVDEDDAVDATTWYSDSDGDGWGDAASTALACSVPSGFVAASGDCNDTAAAVSPSATETCNDTDDDCDGDIDEDDASDATTWYPDSDGDGYGDDDLGSPACVQPSGSIGAGGDCRDDNSDVHPDADEVPCDGLDNDCAGDGDIRCVPEGEHDLGDAETILYGAAAGDAAGWQVGMGGDTDGDGVSEALVMSPQIVAVGDDYYRGIISWMESPPYGERMLSELDASIEGDAAGDDATGNDVAFIQDVDGDGLDDLAIGHGSDFVFIFQGPFSGRRSLATPDLSVTGTTSTQPIGSAVTSGDLNGDGLADLIYSTALGVKHPGSGWLEETGQVWAFYGPLTADVATDDADVVLVHDLVGGNFGHALCASDFTGDGIDDLAVGAPCDAGCTPQITDGAVWVVHGPISGEVQVNNGGVLGDAAALWHGGDGLDTYAGATLSCRGDVDGDGRPDLAVGAKDTNGDAYGSVYLLDGSTTGEESLTNASWSLVDTMIGAYLGTGLTSDSDLDGDGFADMAVAHYTDSAHTGEVILFLGGELSGGASPSDADATWFGHSSADLAVHLDGGADLDGDGFHDLLVGAPGEDTMGTSAGAAYIIYGGGWVP